VLHGWVAVTMMLVAWLGAALGGVLAWVPGSKSRTLCSAMYIVLGWAVVIATPQLIHRLTVSQLVLIAIGGALYTGGAITLATRRPDPFPRVFGYHEVWHVAVVAAAICQLIAIASLVSGPIPV
jgi:hemolysin III